MFPVGDVKSEDSSAACLRIISQYGRSVNAPHNSQSDSNPDSIVLNSIKKLLTLNERGDDFVAVAVPILARVFHKVIAKPPLDETCISILLCILKFYLSSGEEAILEGEKSLASFFTLFLAKQYANDMVSSKCVTWLSESKDEINKFQPSILPKYFPLLLKVMMWHAPKFDSVFLSLIPAMMAKTSFLPLFSSIVDLPVLALALEDYRWRFGALPGEDSNLKATGKDAGMAVFALLDSAYTGAQGGADSGDEGDEADDRGEQPTAFKSLLGNVNSQGGLEIGGERWTNPGLTAVLQAHSGPGLPDRVKQAMELAPGLIKSYFSQVQKAAGAETVAALLTFLLNCADFVLPLNGYNSKIFPLFVDFLREALEDDQTQSLPSLLSGPIGAFLEQTSTSQFHEELALQLCYVLGEISGSYSDQPTTTQSLFGSLQRLLFDSLAASAAEHREIAKNPSQELDRAAKFNKTRMLRILVSSLSKIATCHPDGDLIPKAVTALSKVSRSGEFVDPSVVLCADQHLSLLRDPALCGLVFRPITDCHPGRENFAPIPFAFLSSNPNSPCHDFTMEDVFGRHNNPVDM